MSKQISPIAKRTALIIMSMVVLAGCTTPDRATPTATIQPEATMPVPTSTTSPQSIPSNVGGLYFAPSLTIATGETLTQQEIAEALFTNWLTHFKDVGQEDARYKIDDYEVIQVTIPEELQSCSNKLRAEFVATGIFSVKPTDKLASGWFAGGGNISDDQLWITKSHDVAILLDNGVYSWKLLGVPPCW